MGKDSMKVWWYVFSGRGMVLALAALLWGCGDMPGDMNADASADEEPIGTTSEALTRLATYTDPTGSITVTYYVCGWSAASTQPRATCTVPSTEALVGGGAEIEGDNPDAMVRASYPAGTQTWLAESTTFLIPTSHRVRARAMGLRLRGVSGSALRSQLMITSGAGPSSFDSVAFAGLPMSGTVLVGGGAAVISGSSHLLYNTSPNIPCRACESDGWLAASKAHGASPSGGRARAYAIWLPECPSGYSEGCLVSRLRTGDVASPDGGYISMRQALPGSPSDPFSNVVLTSLGGWAHSPDGPGRFLAGLYPYWSPSAGAPAGRVASKDHLLHDPGLATFLFLLGLEVAD